MAPVKRRSYLSPLRAEQSARTREAVLDAAKELFLAQGYGATTIEQVAARAGVSKPTVFAAVGNKQALLKTVRDVAMAGDDDQVPVAERPSVQKVAAAASAEEALSHAAAHIAALQARYARVDEVLRGAAAVGEVELAELWRTSEEQRRIGAGILVDLVQKKGPLQDGLDTGRAADILSVYMAPDVFARFVYTLGWAPEEYALWLAATLSSQLLGR